MAVPRFCVRLKPNNAAKKDNGKEAVGDMYAVSPDCVEGMRMWMSSFQGNSELDEDTVIPTPALTPRTDVVAFLGFILEGTLVRMVRVSTDGWSTVGTGFLRLVANPLQ